jgi:hypothetical protein
MLFIVMFFFACPKKNQKKTPAKDYIPFAGSSYVELLYYCDFGICSLLFFVAIGVPQNHP